ncbi:MAG: Na+/H+ antiporter NhaA [Thermoleophilia bacterium]
MQQFMHTESSSGLVLALAALVAMVWVNVDASSYLDLWKTKLSIGLGDEVVSTTLQKFAKDALMAVFFLVVGLEIKREITIGELAQLRLAVVPLFAALGGMILPAAIYVSLNAGGPGADGWGIPMATDIAFALGVLVLLGRRVPGQLGAFLLGIAVIDDIGAILVIAIFYTSSLDVVALALAAASLAAVWVMFAWRVRIVVPYAVLGIVAWVFMTRSGVSPTLAGVVLGLLVPVTPWSDPQESAGRAREVADELVESGHTRGASLGQWRRMDDLGRQAVPMAERLEILLHPWTAFLVLPVFALAWAGVPLDGEVLRRAAESPITIGIVVGLVVGKIVGVAFGAWLAVRLGLGVLPPGVRWPHVVGVSALAGIGFTVSVFVASLAFTDAALIDEAKVGIVAASVLAATLGVAVLSLVGRGREAAAGTPR